MAEERNLSVVLGSDILYDWDHSKMIEVTLPDPDAFLKIKETLSRIGVGNTQQSVLTQTCHILHQGGRYFICHFKELFRLEGKHSDISINDMARRNTIINLLKDWKMLNLVDPSRVTKTLPMSSICVVSFDDKHKWKLVHKHRLGAKKIGSTH